MIIIAAAILGPFTTFLLGLVALRIGKKWGNKFTKRQDEIHVLVNGRLSDALLQIEYLQNQVTALNHGKPLPVSPPTTVGRKILKTLEDQNKQLDRITDTLPKVEDIEKVVKSRL